MLSDWEYVQGTSVVQREQKEYNANKKTSETSVLPKITIDAVLMWKRPLRCTSQWLRLPEICYRLSLIGENMIEEANNIFRFLMKIVLIFCVNNLLTSKYLL